MTVRRGIVGVGHVHEGRSVSDTAHVEARQTGFLLEFAKSTFLGRLVSLDMTAWCAPAKCLVTYQDGRGAIGRQDPGGGAHMTGGAIRVVVEKSQEFGREFVVKLQMSEFAVHVRPPSGYVDGGMGKRHGDRRRAGQRPCMKAITSARAVPSVR